MRVYLCLCFVYAFKFFCFLLGRPQAILFEIGYRIRDQGLGLRDEGCNCPKAISFVYEIKRSTARIT